ncbi:MAG: assimilatory sulfite reductase (NADPH) flavoprotein subunit [Draconibacterium sp.]
MSLKSNPLNENQLKALGELVNGITAEQMIWLSGYFEGRLAGMNGTVSLVPVVESVPVSNTNLTILYGSETGRSQSLAEKLAEKAKFKGISANVFSMYDYNYKKLQEEDNLAIIVSTHGEGDPPDMAEDFHKFITGKRAPRLEHLNFSVLALGDKTYKFFCKTGEDIYDACRSLGAFSVTPLMKCDVDYEVNADIWMNNLLVNLTPAEPVASAATEEVKKSVTEYSKKNPYMATILEKVKITGRDSDKEVYHLELDLDDSGITYEPGDSVGIFAKNPDQLVEQIIKNTGFDPEHIVDLEIGEVTFHDALSYHLEITVVTIDMLQKYLEKTKNQDIEKLLKNEEALDEYLYGHDLLDMLEDFPHEWHPQKLVEILRALPPRLYSISSSQEKVGDEVHVTVSVVRYEKRKRMRLGACSSHLADNIDLDSAVPIYIEKNPSFKLPANGSKIIMVGAGTGIAPYRAFLQHREMNDLKGGSWLFFGDRRFNSDFLYQVEWQRLLESNYLEKMDVAFSRDQEQKVYVQHKLLENKEEVFKWIEDGAYFYLCGDMKHMAKDVNKTLLQIIQEQGGVSEAKAVEYVKKLKREKRFQSDVY